MSEVFPANAKNSLHKCECLDVSSVQTLISYIRALLEGDGSSPLLEVIEYPNILIMALEELDSLVEMYDLKKAIVQEIQLMLILAYKRIGDGKKVVDKFDGHMLHTVLYGPPGVGKSRAAKCIAKIFYALGVTAQLKRNIHNTPSPRNSSEQSVQLERSPNQRQIPEIVQEPIQVKIIPDPSVVDCIANEAGAILQGLNSFRERFPSLKNPELDQTQTLITDISQHSTNIITLCSPVISPDTEATLPDDDELKSPVQHPPASPEEIKTEIPVVVCGRTEFVGEYSGQTTPKTHKFLMDNRGKVVIIEEAYLLYTGEKDQFGMEALTELNRFMDEHAKEIIVILTGYRELMASTIFRAQEGLRRRCQLVFDIKGYTYEGLAKIFNLQLKALEWRLTPQIDIADFFRVHLNDFPSYGGDTEKLAYQCKLAFTSLTFGKIQHLVSDHQEIQRNLFEFIITQEHLDIAYTAFIRNKVAEEQESPPPAGMYL